ncbi:MAG: methyltransferase [Polyangiales bacterium]
MYPPLPRPSSFEIPREKLPDAPPGFLIRLLIAIRRFFQMLADAVVPAEIALFERSAGLVTAHLLSSIVRFGVADALAERTSTGELAKRTGTNHDALHRTLRGLASMGIFTMHADGTVEHSHLSKALRSGQRNRSAEWLLYFASGSNAAAWADHAETLRTGKSAFDRVHGKNVWEWFDEHPDEREMFAHAMMGLTFNDAPFVAGLYPFEEVKTLCDVGGGRGTLLSELLLRFPHLRGVLCDGEGVIESAREFLGNRGVIDRVTLQPGSFFAEVPTGADTYLMKNILHDWDDDRCKTILRVVRKAMASGTKLVLVETLIGRNEPAEFAAVADLQMMIACSDGRERSLEDFRALLEATGFRLGRVNQGVTVSVIEGIAA